MEIPPDALLEDYLRQGIPEHDAQGFHRTGTLDFMEGRLRLILDEGRQNCRRVTP